MDEIVPSPVEADKYLIEGELPFTAFGHHGEGFRDIRVFLQNVYWVNSKGEPFFLEEMSEEYLQNVLFFLFADVETYYSKMSFWYVTELLASALGYVVVPEEYSEKVVAEAERIKSSSPVDWLNSTLLVRKITALLDAKE